jgi:hypothetical protein
LLVGLLHEKQNAASSGSCVPHRSQYMIASIRFLEGHFYSNLLGRLLKTLRVM